MMPASDAHNLIIDCGQAEAARAALESAILGETIKIEARNALYRQRGGNVQPAGRALTIDRKMWVRIEQSAQVDSVWNSSSAKLPAAGGGAVDLYDIVVERPSIMRLVKQHAGSSKNRKGSVAGPPARMHGATIDYVMRYLRNLPPGRALGLKNSTIGEILDAAYMHIGGRSLGIRGLRTLSAEVVEALKNERVDPELKAKLDEIAGISGN